MKIIQSFWSKPFNNSKKEIVESRLFGGWPEKKFCYMSWALSCLQIRKYYDDVELITDNDGAKLLIDDLGLPYTSVVTDLEALNDYSAELWAIGKIYSYSKQEQPFLHLDNDVFISGAFSKELVERPLAAQHFENGYSFYKRVYEIVKANCTYIPEIISLNCTGDMPIYAYNMGIVGGSDICFFKKYAAEALRFVEQNSAFLKKEATGPINAFYEQVLFYYMSQADEQPVSLYSKLVTQREIDLYMKGLEAFAASPGNGRMIHLYGNCKLKTEYCRELEKKMKFLYPEMYDRIIQVDKKSHHKRSADTDDKYSILGVR